MQYDTAYCMISTKRYNRGYWSFVRLQISTHQFPFSFLKKFSVFFLYFVLNKCYKIAEIVKLCTKASCIWRSHLAYKWCNRRERKHQKLHVNKIVPELDHSLHSKTILPIILLINKASLAFHDKECFSSVVARMKRIVHAAQHTMASANLVVQCKRMHGYIIMVVMASLFRRWWFSEAKNGFALAKISHQHYAYNLLYIVILCATQYISIDWRLWKLSVKCCFVLALAMIRSGSKTNQVITGVRSWGWNVI